MRFVFLQLCVLLLIASCSVASLDLFIFFNRSMMPVGFLQPSPQLGKVFLLCTNLTFSHHCGTSGQLSCQKSSKLANKNTKVYQMPHFRGFLMLIDILACVHFVSDTKLDNF